ncbi:MAG TPA: nuclear transport factor 2 family protein [Allosphingosinicella sp.]|jgi:ketosteroid isomerase-like protein
MLERIVLCASAALAGALAASSAMAAPRDRPGSAAAPSASQPEAAVQAFVAAFNALDRARFDALFAEDVTLFFPSSPFPLKRVEGKKATLEWFGRFFDSLRKRGAGPGIQPQDLKVQDYGKFAIATFHLGGGESVSRRTVVLRREKGRWAIAHLHASSLTERR